MNRLPDRLWVPALAGLVLALAFVAALAIRADGDLSLLVHAGPPWTDAATAPDSLTVQDAEEAFDGQFFYRLGVDPLSAEEQVAGVTFDVPSVRWSRWGYGALAHALSGTDTDLVPEALVALNVAAAAALGGVGGGLARAFGRHAAWGVLFVLWPGFAYSISLDTAELVACAFALGGLLACHHRRWGLAALLLAAGIVTRDSTVVLAFGVGALGLLRLVRGRAARRWPGPLAVGVAVGSAYIAWQLLARARFGELPASEAGALNLGAPFADLAGAVADALVPSSGDEAFRLLSFAGLFALIGSAGWAWWSLRSRVAADLRGSTDGVDSNDEGVLGAAWLAWVPAVAVVALMTDYVLAGATSFMRTSAEVAVLSMLLLLAAAPRRLLALAVAGSGGLWLLTAVAQIAKLG